MASNRLEMEERISRITEALAELIEKSGTSIDLAKGKIDQEGTLKELALDRKWVNHLREEAMSGRLTFEKLESYAKDFLIYLSKAAPELSDRAIKKEATIREEYSLLFEILKDPSILQTQMDSIHLKADKMPKGKVRDFLLDALAALKKKELESEELSRCLNDILSWNFSADPDPISYQNRILTYLKGGYHNGKRFSGLFVFNDEALNQKIRSDDEFLRFREWSKKNQQRTKLIAEILSAEKELQKDVKGGVWVQDVETARFVKGLEKFARKIEELGGKEFAMQLLANKGIGEQEEKWDSLLLKEANKMRDEVVLEASSARMLFERLGKRLCAIFDEREKQIKEESSKDIKKSKEFIEKTLYKTTLEEELGFFEETIAALWKIRKKTLKKKVGIAAKQSEKGLRKLNELLEKASMEEEVLKTEKVLERTIGLGKERVKLSDNLTRSPRSLQTIIGLLENNAESLSLFETALGISSAAQRREERLRQLDLKPYLKEANDALLENLKILQWLKKLISFDAEMESALTDLLRWKESQRNLKRGPANDNADTTKRAA